MSRLLDRRRWLSPRRKRFWMATAVLAYLLAGFFLVPYIAEHQLPALISETLQRPATVANVDVNPLTLSATVEGFALTESDGV